MRLIEWRPAPALRPFIAGYSGYRQADGVAGRHRGLPGPHLTLIVTLDDPLVVAAHPDPRTPPGRYDALVGGLHTAPALITHDGRQSGIQIGLSPLGARALLGLPAGELAGLDVDASDVWGRFAAHLRERLLAEPTWPARFAVLDELLSRRLDPAAAVRPDVAAAWHALLDSGGRMSMSSLAERVGCSGRYLSRLFAVEIGMSPKAAARVLRFDRARRLLPREPSRSVAEVAARCGYFDQAHLARDFRALAGCPPSRWLAEEFRNIQAAPDPGAASSVA